MKSFIYNSDYVASTKADALNTIKDMPNEYAARNKAARDAGTMVIKGTAEVAETVVGTVKGVVGSAGTLVDFIVGNWQLCAVGAIALLLLLKRL